MIYVNKNWCTTLIGTLMLLCACNPHSSNHNNSKNSVIIAFAGDTMLGRTLNTTIQQKGYAYPWGNVLPILHKTDLNIINLETTFTESKKAVPKVFNFKSDLKNVQALIVANINVVSLANNHIGDFGNKGLLETIKTLNKANIKHVGAGNNETSARQAVIITKNNVKIGIIGATDNEPTWKAGPNTPGTNYFSVNNYDQLIKDIATLKQQVDIVIVSLHWGPNMRERPTQEYINAAHAMINAGADIIHGHSAHIFQGIEIYKNKLIMYDTGDFVDDYAIDKNLRNDRSFLFIVEVDKNNVKSFQLIPLLINNMQVTIAEGTNKTEAVKRMQRLSQEFGTILKNGLWNRKTPILS